MDAVIDFDDVSRHCGVVIGCSCKFLELFSDFVIITGKLKIRVNLLLERIGCDLM